MRVWKANVVPVFKTVEKYRTSNYHLISLTFIVFWFFEPCALCMMLHFIVLTFQVEFMDQDKE